MYKFTSDNRAYLASCLTALAQTRLQWASDTGKKGVDMKVLIVSIATLAETSDPITRSKALVIEPEKEVMRLLFAVNGRTGIAVLLLGGIKNNHNYNTCNVLLSLL